MKEPESKQPRSRNGCTTASSPWRKCLPLTVVVGAFILIVALYCTAVGIMEQETRVNNTLMEWTEAYHLTEAQADRIRQIELEFHGNGNPITSRRAASAEETKAHNLTLSREMNPEDGAHFLDVMTLNRGRH